MILILLGFGVAIAAICYWVKSGGKVTSLSAKLGGAIPSWDAYGGVFGQYSGLRPEDKL